MESIYKIAKYFLSRESMTHKKLQKLCYFAQAWYLANYGKALVYSRFEAWVHGPVSPDLYSEYRTWGWEAIPQENVSPIFENANVEDFLNRVYETYGNYDGDTLERITHAELPWQKARGTTPDGVYSRMPIALNDMRDYYGERIGRTWN